MTMQIITDITKYDRIPCAATIGSFDGVHLGHLAMLGELRSAAAAKGLPLMVVTFATHPRRLFDKECAPFLLTPLHEKVKLLEAAGVDICVLLNFDRATAALSAARFMADVLVAQLGVQLLAVGYDHHFGRPAPGEGLGEYIAMGKGCGIEAFGTAPFIVDGTAVSSSAVRRALSAGDVVLATHLLGRCYSLTGTVVHGAGIGRVLGFPTANISPVDKEQMLPLDGVYETDVTVDGNHFKGVMNIGMKPTVNGKERTNEVHIIGFGGDIYGKEIAVQFVRRLRGEQVFENVDALRLQIEQDIAMVKHGF